MTVGKYRWADRRQERVKTIDNKIIVHFNALWEWNTYVEQLSHNEMYAVDVNDAGRTQTDPHHYYLARVEIRLDKEQTVHNTLEAPMNERGIKREIEEWPLKKREWLYTRRKIQYISLSSRSNLKHRRIEWYIDIDMTHTVLHDGMRSLEVNTIAHEESPVI